ncbi:MAG TPA: helix-turn-helix transcriptional regulator [Dehalococcoidia bacterium]|nr:helix-turn-helix transcriptional regulator [Dehalococcoidia bacterium]
MRPRPSLSYNRAYDGGAREIAEELVLSERTVQRHVADLYLKIDVRNRAEAVGYARDHAERQAV